MNRYKFFDQKIFHRLFPFNSYVFSFKAILLNNSLNDLFREYCKVFYLCSTLSTQSVSFYFTLFHNFIQYSIFSNRFFFYSIFFLSYLSIHQLYLIFNFLFQIEVFISSGYLCVYPCENYQHDEKGKRFSFYTFGCDNKMLTGMIIQFLPTHHVNVLLSDQLNS